MTNRRSRRKHTPNRSATRVQRDRPLEAVPEPDEAEADLLELIRSSLRSKDPTSTATLVSSLIQAASAEPELDEDPEVAAVTLEAFIDSFVGSPYAETTAALHVIAALLPDEVEAARVRRVLAGRRHPVPEAVSGVRDITVERAARMGDELGDGDNVILGLGWPGTRGVTMVVYVDEAFGTRVKDVFLVPEPFDVVCGWYREALPQQGRDSEELVDTSIADARASIAQAVGHGDAPDAPLTPEDWSGPDGEPLGWPSARPFVEMLLRRMPTGGTSLLSSTAYPAMTAEEAVEGFLGSDGAAGLPAAVDVEGAARLLARDAEEGAGHPLRWSPTQVELALTQRLPWAGGAEEDALEAVPDVLPAFVRHAHERLGISGAATADTLAAVVEWMPAFEALCDAAPAARWRQIGTMMEAFDQGDHAPLLLQSLADEVGGQEALDHLDAEPLPAGRPALDEVAADVRETLTAIAALVDEWFDRSSRVESAGGVGEEWRTATHRLLVGAAERDPSWLRRRADARSRAAGAIWATGVANRLMGVHGLVLVKDLAADLGVKGAPSAKAEALLRAWGVPAWDYDVPLGDSRLLVSTYRAEITTLRDQYRG